MTAADRAIFGAGDDGLDVSRSGKAARHKRSDTSHPGISRPGDVTWAARKSGVVIAVSMKGSARKEPIKSDGTVEVAVFGASDENCENSNLLAY